MRIAFAHDYSMEHIGGTPTSLLEQKRALEEAGHTVFVIQLASKPAHPTYDNHNFLYIKPQIIMPEAFYRMSYIFANSKHDAIIKKMLEANKIEIVHTQSELTLAYAVVKVAKELGIPVVSTIHSFYWGQQLPAYMQAIAPVMTGLLEKATRRRLNYFKVKGKPVEKAFKNWTLGMARQADMVISPSKHQAEDMKRVWPELKVTCIPNPLRNLIDIEPKLVTSKEHVFTLAWAGRVDPEKRPLEFMLAVEIAQMLTKIPFRVDFIGSGTVMKNIKRRFQLPDVTFHGKQSHRNAVALIDQADVLFMSSYHYDNQPMVIAEAISRYKPVIYCDEQLTEGVDHAGYLSKNESPEAMAEAIAYLVERPKTVQSLSKKAKDVSKIFLPETYVENVIKVYKAVIGPKL